MRWMVESDYCFQSEAAKLRGRVTRSIRSSLIFFFQAEDGIRDHCVTGVQTCALPISSITPSTQLRVYVAGTIIESAPLPSISFQSVFMLVRATSCAFHPCKMRVCAICGVRGRRVRSEEHTSELQSHSDLVCRLLLEKK